MNNLSINITKQAINTQNAPAAIGPYAQGIDIGFLVYTSGQLPISPQTGEMPQSVAEQTNQCLENVKAVLEAAGSKIENIIKTTVFLKDMNSFVEMNNVYASYFEAGNVPARSAVEVARLPKDAMVEIEVIAYK